MSKTPFRLATFSGEDMPSSLSISKRESPVNGRFLLRTVNTGDCCKKMPTRRFILILVFPAACWFGMLIVHEAGHVLAAWLSGATVERVVLLPISRTDTSGVEYPLFVHGAGAVFGAMFPVLLWSIVRLSRCRFAYLFRFFAGFCLTANGAYIGADFSTAGPTDAGMLMEHGAARIPLVLFGVVCVSCGLFLWHGQSRYFFPEPESRLR